MLQYFTNTFQGILITNETYSYAVFIYECELCCFVFLLYCVALPCLCTYILGFVFGVFVGLITAAFSFMLSLSPPVYQVVMLWLMCFGCFVLICMCDSAQPAELPYSSSVGKSVT